MTSVQITITHLEDELMVLLSHSSSHQVIVYTQERKEGLCMYVLLYNRLTGWLWFAVGIWGVFAQNIGDYILLTRPETYVSIALGLLGMFGARVQLRNQVIICASLTLINLIILVLASAPVGKTLVGPTPLEGVFRFLCTLWGGYCLYNEVRFWIVRQKQAA